MQPVDPNHAEAGPGPAPPYLEKWRTLVALGVLAIAAVLDWNWPWGVIFLLWAGEAIRDRQTYLVEDIARESNPLLFWALVCTWLLSGGYLLLLDFDLVGPGAR